MKRKVCFKCGLKRNIENFYKHAEMADGHLNKCIDCAKSDVRKNRKENVEYYRAYDRARGNRQSSDYRKRYARDNPIKYGAMNLVNNAIRDKKLKKKKRCESCGKKGRLHGHHDDYAKPLEVRWLCPPCHFDWHAKHGEGLNS